LISIEVRLLPSTSLDGTLGRLRCLPDALGWGKEWKSVIVSKYRDWLCGSALIGVDIPIFERPI